MGTHPCQKPRSLIALRTDQRFRIGARKERSQSSADAMPSLPPEIAKISVISTLKSKIGELKTPRGQSGSACDRSALFASMSDGDEGHVNCSGDCVHRKEWQVTGDTCCDHDLLDGRSSK